MKSTFARTPLSVAVTAMLLAACGGGNGNSNGNGDTAVAPSSVTNGVPASATNSSAGAVAFVKSLAAASDDTAEPIVLGDAVLATSETEEPDAGI